jgi:hypothetical protein
MNFRRRLRILTSRKSPSTEMMKRTYNRAFSNGGVVQDFTANVENLRSLSRALGYDNVDRGGNIFRRNLVSYSEDFGNAYWIKNIVTVTVNSDANPLDGALTADRITSSGAGTAVRMYNVVSYNIGTQNSFSFYIKNIDANYLHIRTAGTPKEIGFSIKMSDMSIAAGFYDGTNSMNLPSSYLVTPVSNGYYRVSFPKIGFGTYIFFYFSDSATSTSATSGKSVYLYGLQIEAGTLSDYQATTNVVAGYTYLNPASFTYVPASYGEGKNFVEVHNKRNLFSWSEDFTNAVWNGNALGTVRTANATTAPNNTLTADKLTEIAGVNDQHYFSYTTLTTTVGVNYTFSVYAKAAERPSILLQYVDGGVFNNAIFYLTNGTITYVDTTQPVITDVGNGWYRCSISKKAVTTSGRFTMIIGNGPTTAGLSYVGVANSGIYIWGAQLEQSNGVGAYLPKTNAVLDNNVDFTFSRATPATVTNKLGVIEDSCYNILQNSEVFDNASWIKFNSVITANAIIAPNGTLTADKLIANTVNAFHYVYVTAGAYTDMTFSVYFKTAELTDIGLQFDNDGSASQATTWFYLSNGSKDIFYTGSGWTNGVSSISKLNNDWYRISFSVTRVTGGSITLAKIFLSKGGASFVGNNSEGIYIWGAQLEQGSSLRPYLKTTNRLNVPRLDYSRNSSKPSLLIESSRTNLVRYSSDITTVWGTNGSIRTANVILSPDRTISGDKLAEVGASSTHDLYTGIVMTPNVYTWSVYVKAAERSNIVMFNSTSGNTSGARCNINLVTGVVNSSAVFGTATNVVARTVNIGNGWWRCILTCTHTVSATLYPYFSVGLNDSDIGVARVGTAGYGIYVWGMQFEQSPIATTYIPTTTVGITRNDETNYVDLFNNAMFNKQNWTLFWEGYSYDGSGTNISFALSDSTGAGSDTNQIGWYNNLIPFYNVANTRTNDVSRLNTGISNRFAIQYDNGVVNYYVNGFNVWSNQSVPVFDYRYLVLNSGGSTFTTDKICLWPRTLSNWESFRITTKMVAYYKLDSNSVDTLGLNSGVDTSMSYTVGKVGNCATFNGSSSFISVPQSTDFDFTNGKKDIPFSVSMWINKTSSIGTYMILLAKETATQASFNVRFGSAGNQLEVVLATSTGNYKWWQYPGTYTNATWYHVAVTYDGSAQDSGVKLYLNNVLKTPVMQNLGTYSTMPIINAPLTIGQSGYTGNKFSGKIDELAIWKDYILSTSEITDLYNKGLTGSPIM